MHPADFDIPGDFRHWPGDAAEDHIGPFFFRPTEFGCETAFRVRPHNLNGGGRVHGGVLMAFADYTVCLAATAGTDEHVVTVSFNSEFVAAVQAGDLVLGRGELVRRATSLAFTRCTLTVDDKPVLVASAVVKRVRR